MSLYKFMAIRNRFLFEFSHHIRIFPEDFVGKIQCDSLLIQIFLNLNIFLGT